MEDLRMMLLYFNSEKGMNYYYSNETQQIYAMKNKGSGGLQVGLVAGTSMIIYFVLNKIDVQIKTNVNILYWTTLILGIIAGQILFYIGKKRLDRLIKETAVEYTCSKLEIEQFVKEGKKQLGSNTCLVIILLIICFAYRPLMMIISPYSAVVTVCHFIIWTLTILLLESYLYTKPIARYKYYKNI